MARAIMIQKIYLWLLSDSCMPDWVGLTWFTDEKQVRFDLRGIRALINKSLTESKAVAGAFK